MDEAARAPDAEKYLVRPYAGGWRITCDAGQSTTFTRPEDAVREACTAARRTARNGRLSLVVTETSPQEFHCFLPGPLCAVGAGVATLPDYLRLIVPEA